MAALRRRDLPRLVVLGAAFLFTWSGLDFTVHTVTYGSSSLQSGDLVKPETDKATGVVMLIHGGFWKAGFDRSLMIDISDDLLAQGFYVWNVDYRSVGSGGGYPNTLEDVSLALNWLTSDAAASFGVQIPELPLGIVGHSAGGHLATWLALQGLIDGSDFGLTGEIRPKIVVSQAGVLDLQGAYEANLGRSAVRDLIGSPPTSANSRMQAASNGAVLDVVASPLADADERFTRADPVKILADVPTAQLSGSDAILFALVHGENDDIVPPSQSAAFQSALAGRGAAEKCIYNLIPGEGHFEHLRRESGVWSSTADLLKKYLTKP